MNSVSCRLWGKCWGDPADPARLVVKWAGQQVFDGPVPTNADSPDAQQTAYHDVLCTWTINNVTAGLVPVEITVHNGSASVNNILLNNIVAGRYVHFKPDMADIENIYFPEPPRSDINVLTYTEEEFLELYRFPQDAPPDYVEYVDVPAADTWVDGNFNWRMKNDAYTDGKLNVKINGTDWFGTDVPLSLEQIEEALLKQGYGPLEINELILDGEYKIPPGERNYLVNNGDTLSFDYLIEWDIA